MEDSRTHATATRWTTVATVSLCTWALLTTPASALATSIEALTLPWPGHANLMADAAVGSERDAAVSCPPEALLSVQDESDDSNAADSGTDEPEIPPIPQPDFEDPKTAEQFTAGLEALEAKNYRDARSSLRKIRSKGESDEEKDAIARALLEAEGGLDAESISKLVGRGRYRRALAKLAKVMEDYPKTFAGARLEELEEECREFLFFVIADFEPAEGEDVEEDESDEDGGEGGNEGERWARELLGDTGYGAETAWQTGDVGEAVFAGKRALRWKADGGIAWISFNEKPESFEDYRYLYFAVRTAPGEKKASLRMLFDCEAVPLRAGGGRQGAAGLLFRRTGFFAQTDANSRWTEVRLDLRKLQAQGDARWDEVKALRLVHTGSVTARVIVDEIRLEKE